MGIAILGEKFIRRPPSVAAIRIAAMGRRLLDGTSEPEQRALRDLKDRLIVVGRVGEYTKLENTLEIADIHHKM